VGWPFKRFPCYDKLDFDFLRDVVPIASLIRSGKLMEVNLAVPVRTVPNGYRPLRQCGAMVDTRSSMPLPATGAAFFFGRHVSNSPRVRQCDRPTSS
jgi:hypothetical protein